MQPALDLANGSDVAAPIAHAVLLGVAYQIGYGQRMRGIKKYMLLGFGVLCGLVTIAVGAWIYVVSNVEQPRYAIIKHDGSMEIRDYPALLVAEVTRRGDRNTSVRAGFGPLAGYIFAKNRTGESVSMTAPVTQTLAGSDQAETWMIRFIMPAKYTLETLPKATGDDVRLLQMPAARRAAIRFSGVATDALVAANETALREWLAVHKIGIVGAPTYAYYNDPFTPGPLRRNEVLFEVQEP